MVDEDLVRTIVEWARRQTSRATIYATLAEAVGCVSSVLKAEQPVGSIRAGAQSSADIVHAEAAIGLDVYLALSSAAHIAGGDPAMNRDYSRPLAEARDRGQRFGLKPVRYYCDWVAAMLNAVFEDSDSRDDDDPFILWQDWLVKATSGTWTSLVD